MESQIASHLENTFADSLRAHGLRATRPRLLVLDLLQSVRGHYSADEIVELLVDRGTPIPRASVYNVVGALVDCGLLTMITVGPGSARYESGDIWHHHFVCKACGEISDVACAVGEKPCLEPQEIPGTVEEAQITFRGVCHGCQNRST